MNTATEKTSIANAVTVLLKHDQGFEVAKAVCLNAEVAAAVTADWAAGHSVSQIEKNAGAAVHISYAK